MAEEKIIRVNPNYKYWEVFRLSGPEEWEFWGDEIVGRGDRYKTIEEYQAAFEEYKKNHNFVIIEEE